MLAKAIRCLVLVPALFALPALAQDSASNERFETRLGPSDSGAVNVSYVFDVVTQFSWAPAPWNYFSYTAKDPCQYISRNMAFKAPSSDELETLLSPAGAAAQFPGGLHGDFYTTERQGENGYVVNFDAGAGRYISLPTHAPWGAGVQVLCVQAGSAK